VNGRGRALVPPRHLSQWADGGRPRGSRQQFVASAVQFGSASC